MDSVISGENFYDADGRPSGFSTEGIFGGHDFYNNDGQRVGWSTDGLFGGENMRFDDNAFGPDSPPGADGFGGFGDPVFDD